MNPALQTRDVVLDEPAAMPEQTVPQQQQRPAQVSNQGLEKIQHTCALLIEPGYRRKQNFHSA